jgi:ATP-dependent Zn protease
MVNQKFVNYIQKGVKKGYTANQLKTHLIQHGYDSNEVTEAANYVSKNKQSKNSPIDFKQDKNKKQEKFQEKKKSKLWLWILLSFVGLIFLAGIAYFIYTFI